MDPAYPSGGRRMLKKSRSGCRDCRRRKVKCDEIKSVCSNCRRRYVDIQCCVWDSHSPGHRNRRQLSPDQSSNSSEDSLALHKRSQSPHEQIKSIDVHPSSLSDSNRWRSLELRLMYHYATVVSGTMPGCKGAPREAWQFTIPQLSFDSEVVLNPMLTLAALHLNAHAHRDLDMKVALRRYLDLSLVNHRQALCVAGSGSKEEVWLSSVMLSHMYWLLARHQQPGEAYRFPIQAFKMLEGTGSLFKQYREFLQPKGYDWIGNETLPDTSNDLISAAAEAQLQSIEDDLTTLLNALNVWTMTTDLQNIYAEASQYILTHYRAFYCGVETKTLQRFSGFMAVRCQPGFLNLLGEHDPLAMALMARMWAMLSQVDAAWWMDGSGEYETTEGDIRGMRELMPAELRWTMEWPIAVLDREIVLVQDGRV